MKPPAHAIAEMPRSGIREVMDIAASRPDVLHLEVGEPDFETPEHIVEAAARAAADGYTKYTPNRGYVSLRELLSEKLARRNGLDVRPDNVVVATGGVTAIIETLMALVEPGEEVLIPDPGWPNYAMMLTTLGIVPVRYRLAPELGFEPDLDELRAHAGRPRAKLMIVNSPANPTGAVWRRETIEQIVEIAQVADLYVVSDEVYEDVVFEGEHVSPGTLDGDRVISVFSFSKAYAMTGWRVGYLAAADPVASIIAKVQEVVVSCASSVAQKAAEAALTGPQGCVATMRDAYRARRDLASKALREGGLLLAEPHGAFYVLADISRATGDTYAFARWLVTDRGVAVAPGETFGPGGAGLVRLSLASSQAVIEEGVQRLSGAVAAWAEDGARRQPSPLAADAASAS